MVDARILNTEAALSAAIISLASATPVSRITVSDVTREASINRATFYSHFASPSELLASVLTADLKRIQEIDHEARLSGDEPAPIVTRRAIENSANHIDRYLSVYRLALSDSTDGTIHHVLGTEFMQSSLEHILNSVAPEKVPGDPRLVAAFVGYGLVGAIEFAVTSDEWDKDRVADVLMAMLPSWWD
jgi:AcrR family transcriptional regulator